MLLVSLTAVLEQDGIVLLLRDAVKDIRVLLHRMVLRVLAAKSVRLVLSSCFGTTLVNHKLLDLLLVLLRLLLLVSSSTVFDVLVRRQVSHGLGWMILDFGLNLSLIHI